MPFEIVRNDIVNMQVDAIVNAANSKPVIGCGCDAGIHKKAGPELLAARQKIGNIGVGEVALTPAFGLDARIVLHAVGPVWQGGDRGERALLRQCYDRALQLAWEQKCESIAFPLLSAGNHGFPKPEALSIALAAFNEFLMNHEMEIYLAVFSKEALVLSEKLFRSVSSYIDENYIADKLLDEYGLGDRRGAGDEERLLLRREQQRRRSNRYRKELQCQAEMMDLAAREAPAPQAVVGAPSPAKPAGKPKLQFDQLDAGFTETLLKLIDASGKKDSDIYKKANVDRRLFSKIRNNLNYRPSKTTALAFAIALELDLDQTRDFISRAGYALTHSSQADLIVEYFILQKNYDMFEINTTLFDFDQSLLGG